MFRFRKDYFYISLLIFVIEVLIAVFVKDNFVRPYLGDVLVVILIYCFLKAFLALPSWLLASFTLVFAFSVETLQYFNIIEKLGLENSTLAKTVIGTSFSWEDIIAYSAGIIIVRALESFTKKKD